MYMIYLLFVYRFILIIRRPPRSTPTETLFPYTTLFRSLRVNTVVQLLSRSASLSAITSARSSPSWATILVASASRSTVGVPTRSEEHTSELQSLMRISYAVFCLKKKKLQINIELHYNNIDKIVILKKS